MGRPRKHDEPIVALYLRLPASVHERLVAIAGHESLNDRLIRATRALIAIDDRRQRRQAADDRARDVAP